MSDVHPPLDYFFASLILQGFKISGYNLEATVMPGESIYDAAYEAVRLRDKAVQERTTFGFSEEDAERITLSFVFNGIPLTAAKGTTPDDLETAFFEGLEANRKAYWTPERLAEQAAETEKARVVLAAYLDTFKDIKIYKRTPTKQLEAAIQWFCGLEPLVRTDTPYDRTLILSKFHRAGLGANMCLKEPEETSEQWVRRIGGRRGQLKWLLGQCLSGVEFVGTPHGVVHKFAFELGVA